MSRFWRVLMGCVLEELLLAFIQVKKCSQEGREQMAMDTTRLYNYATSLCDIQPADDAKDLKYVLDYVTCCKLDEPADVMAWIEKHHAEYGQDVIDSIVNYAMAKKLNKQRFKELKEKVGAFFAEEGEGEKPKESRVCCKQGTIHRLILATALLLRLRSLRSDHGVRSERGDGGVRPRQMTSDHLEHLVNVLLGFRLSSIVGTTPTDTSMKMMFCSLAYSSASSLGTSLYH